MHNTLAAIRARRDEDKGFTLIELMVVVLIIAILIAIAIPTFLGARQRAQDKAAQSSLRNALTAAKTLFTDSESYLTATPAALAGVEPSLTYPTPSTGAKEVSVSTPSKTQILLAAKSASGKCFYMQDNTTTPGAGTSFAEADSPATCTAVGADAATMTVAWNTNGFTG